MYWLMGVFEMSLQGFTFNPLMFTLEKLTILEGTITLLFCI